MSIDYFLLEYVQGARLAIQKNWEIAVAVTTFYVDGRYDGVSSSSSSSSLSLSSLVVSRYPMSNFPISLVVERA